MESHEQERHGVPNGVERAQGWREHVQLLSPTTICA